MTVVYWEIEVAFKTHCPKVFSYVCFCGPESTGGYDEYDRSSVFLPLSSFILLPLYIFISIHQHNPLYFPSFLVTFLSVSPSPTPPVRLSASEIF